MSNLPFLVTKRKIKFIEILEQPASMLIELFSEFSISDKFIRGLINVVLSFLTLADMRPSSQCVPFLPPINVGHIFGIFP